MQRKLLAATVAAGPLLALAFAGAPVAALAQTTISTATTAPVATATANAGAPSNIVVSTAGSISWPIHFLSITPRSSRTS